MCIQALTLQHSFRTQLPHRRKLTMARRPRRKPYAIRTAASYRPIRLSEQPQRYGFETAFTASRPVGSGTTAGEEIAELLSKAYGPDCWKLGATTRQRTLMTLPDRFRLNNYKENMDLHVRDGKLVACNSGCSLDDAVESAWQYWCDRYFLFHCGCSRYAGRRKYDSPRSGQRCQRDWFHRFASLYAKHRQGHELADWEPWTHAEARPRMYGVFGGRSPKTRPRHQR